MAEEACLPVAFEDRGGVEGGSARLVGRGDPSAALMRGRRGSRSSCAEEPELPEGAASAVCHQARGRHPAWVSAGITGHSSWGWVILSRNLRAGASPGDG